MITSLALLGTLLIGLLVGLAVRGCLLLGSRRQFDLMARRLLAEQQIQGRTRETLAAMRQATRDAFRSHPS